MYFDHPRRNPLILFFVKIGSFFFTLPYRIFYSSKVSFGKNFITNWKLKIDGPGKVVFGDNVFAWARAEPNSFLTLNSNATITIGNNVRLNGADIQCASSIKIGDNAIIGSAIIVDTDFHSISLERATDPDALVVTKPVTIEENVWIAGRSALLRGSTIRKNSIVGFGSVVRGEIPANSIAYGNPAKVVSPIK